MTNCFEDSLAAYNIIMKILVTGGCGFIGHNVCLSLMAKGHQVICADIVKAPFVDQVEGLEFL